MEDAGAFGFATAMLAAAVIVAMAAVAATVSYFKRRLDEIDSSVGYDAFAVPGRLDPRWPY